MKPALTVFKKELKDVVRDRRTLITAVLLPLLLFPVLLGVVSKVTTSQTAKTRAKTMNVALISHENAAGLRFALTAAPDINVHEDISEEMIEPEMQNGRVDAAIVIGKNFDEKINNLSSGYLELYFKSTGTNRILKGRLMNHINDYEEHLLAQRFENLEMERSIVSAINIVEKDVASKQEKFGSQVGGLIPYIFILFCYLGCMYPAIDLAAGEKERGTIETLLTSPVSRFQIVLGKFSVVVVAGVASALVSILGLLIGIRQTTAFGEEFISAIVNIFEVQSLLALFSLLLPLTIFFAGILLSISIYTRSFKEAQSAVSPMIFVVIIPAVIGTIPGIVLNPVTALIPILNVALAAKAILSGTAAPGLLFLVFASLSVLAGISLFLASKLFFREEVLFRN